MSLFETISCKGNFYILGFTARQANFILKKMFKKFVLFWLFVVFSFFSLWQCSSLSQKEKSIVLSNEEFDQFLWQHKVIYLNSFYFVSHDKKEDLIKLLQYAFSQNNVNVIISVVNVIGNLQIEELRNLVLNGLRHPKAMVVFHSLVALEKLPLEKKDLSRIVHTFKNRDWMVKEQAFKMVRNYDFEKEQKKYYYAVLTSLGNANESVLKQLYKTLEWYNDKRTFSYVYQRSFRAKNSIELIFILRELSKYKTSTVKKRLYFLANKHPSSLVKDEARKLLLKMGN